MLSLFSDIIRELFELLSTPGASITHDPDPKKRKDREVDHEHDFYGIELDLASLDGWGGWDLTFS